MERGAFSVGLAVKDIEISKSFYEKLSFQVIGGDIDQNWLIMRNGEHTIGLFQGMFDKNIMTFNPGWDRDCNTQESYVDVREIQNKLKAKGIIIDQEIDADSTGPASFTVTDPDGNPILFDQHV